jgi:hypothetical protein
MDIGHAPQNEPNTQATDARKMLQSFCDNGFDGSLSACAVVLGRTREELADMLKEGAVIDDDLLMKMRGVADERGIEI